MIRLTALNLSQEELLILFICRTVSTDDATKAIDHLLNKNLNWDFILKLASLHGIAGLLHVTLSQCSNTGDVPDYILKKLETIYRLYALRNLHYSKEFKEIVTNLNRANIRTIPLKGIEFLHSIYAHNIALRNLSDIDILVEKQNVPHAEKILVDMGYKKKKTSFRFSQRHFHDIFLCSRGKQPIVIELHWDVDFSDSPFNINIEEFWDRSQEFSSEKFTCYRFSIEDSIIFNSFHILREVKKAPDGFLALKHFCDIATIITKSGDKISWEAIIQRSQKYNVMRPVLFVLMLVKELLDVKGVPQTTVDVIRNEGYQDDFSCFAVKKYIFHPQNNENKMIPFWLVEFTDQETLRGKAKLFLDLPKIILTLYNHKYYDGLNHSVIKSILSLTYYYTKKIIKTAALYVYNPHKAILLHKKLAMTNQKTNEVIDWIRG
jgi:hypothetical protein